MMHKCYTHIGGKCSKQFNWHTIKIVDEILTHITTDKYWRLHAKTNKVDAKGQILCDSTSTKSVEESTPYRQKIEG